MSATTYTVATPAFNLEDLRKKIDHVQVVSFDFFDTLFVRPLGDPEDVFNLLGQKFAIENYRELRRAAQQEAFCRMAQAGRSEITLADIYACFAPQTIETQTLLQAEYELERTLIQPNVDLVSLYHETIRSGKTVIIISYMYLPEEFFHQALCDHQLTTVPLFISSQCNATKRDHGALYDLAAAKIEVLPRQILHIGDNYHSDIQQAKNKGLQTFHYTDPRQLPPQKDSTLVASLAQGLLKTEGHALPLGSGHELGFRYGGPAAVGFLNWIAQRAQQDGIEHILFLARDGYSLDLIVKQGASPDLPPCHYLRGSRVAFTLAAINSTNFTENISELLLGSDGLSPYELLERIGVPAPTPQVMTQLGLDDTLKITAQHHEKLAQFLYAWRSTILQTCRQNRRALFTYLHTLGLVPGSRVALVDVGWNGTTQVAFERAIESMLDLDVSGYYFCLADTDLCRQRQTCHTMKALYSSQTGPADIIARMYANRVAVELFFSAPHNAVIGLQCNGDEVISIEDQGRAPVGDLLQTTTDIIQGMTTFAQSYYAHKKRLSLVATSLDESWPLVDLVTTEKWKKIPLFGQIKNFDAWGSSRNRQMSMNDYLESGS